MKKEVAQEGVESLLVPLFYLEKISLSFLLSVLLRF